jgi:18S rRNA (guanine1575-N7)-methyltransferase
MITSAALKAGKRLNYLKQKGFSGSVVVDYPHSTKAKKLYLVLNLGGSE